MITTETPTTDSPGRTAPGVSDPYHFDQVDPLTDQRWPEFLQRHPRAAAFHSRAWLAALQETYGYRPVVFTTSLPSQPLRDGVVACEVESWLVRPRLVSLPFSDHADPLMEHETLHRLLRSLAKGVSERRWTSVEFRPTGDVGEWPGFGCAQRFVLHTLNLEPTLESLFKGFNKDSTQRKIRRASRLGLKYEEGQSNELLQAFFRLVVMTRQRKALPPPPIAWFRNVVRHMGNQAKIRIARTSNGALAGGILTLAFKDTMVFKYGASDVKYHALGTMPFLLWQAIEDAKQCGAATFDFGRSDVDHRGLIHFKDHFGAKQSPFGHMVLPSDSPGAGPGNWRMKFAKTLFARLPERALIEAGKLIYPHIG